MGVVAVYRLRRTADGLVNVFWLVGSRWILCHGPTTEQAALMWVDDWIARPV